MTEGRCGAIQHAMLNKNIDKEDLKAIEKFVKRKGRPNTGTPFKKRFGGTDPGQY
jgi:hypothetical protein